MLILEVATSVITDHGRTFYSKDEFLLEETPRCWYFAPRYKCGHSLCQLKKSLTGYLPAKASTVDVSYADVRVYKNDYHDTFFNGR